MGIASHPDKYEMKPWNADEVPMARDETLYDRLVNATKKLDNARMQRAIARDNLHKAEGTFAEWNQTVDTLLEDFNILSDEIRELDS